VEKKITPLYCGAIGHLIPNNNELFKVLAQFIGYISFFAISMNSDLKTKKIFPIVEKPFIKFIP